MTTATDFATKAELEKSIREEALSFLTTIAKGGSFSYGYARWPMASWPSIELGMSTYQIDDELQRTIHKHKVLRGQEVLDVEGRHWRLTFPDGVVLLAFYELITYEAKFYEFYCLGDQIILVITPKRRAKIKASIPPSYD